VRTDPVVRVEIKDGFGLAFGATFGVLAALALFLLAYQFIEHPDVDSVKVRTLCAHHSGVLKVDSGGATFMHGTAFVTCRDGWYERADN
jgi:cellobiose-specific phosphotransferase system component IIC